MTKEDDPHDADYEKLADGNVDHKDELRSESTLKSSKPWYIVLLLACAVVVGGTSGPLMESMEIRGAGSFALGSWRHQVSVISMLPCCIWQWRRMLPQEQARALTWNNAVTILVCAIGLGAHFSLWIWSLDNTSLTHSLFLGIMSPMFVSLFTFIIYRTFIVGELLGVLLGVVGSTILAAGAEVEHDKEFTVLGDVAALTSACCFAVYLMSGKSLRNELPVFVYLLPVNLGACLLLSIGTVLNNGLNGHLHQSLYGGTGLLGWLRPEFIVRTLFLGLGPGFLSHVGFNTTLGYFKPLPVSMAMTLAPVLGSGLGWLMGETTVPGLLTCIGGLVTMLATIGVSYVSARGSSHEVVTFSLLQINSFHPRLHYPLKVPLHFASSSPLYTWQVQPMESFAL